MYIHKYTYIQRGIEFYSTLHTYKHTTNLFTYKDNIIHMQIHFALKPLTQNRLNAAMLYWGLAAK